MKHQGFFKGYSQDSQDSHGLRGEKRREAEGLWHLRGTGSEGFACHCACCFHQRASNSSTYLEDGLYYLMFS